MKKFTILLYCLVLALNSWCQNIDSAAIKIGGRSVMIDGVPVTRETIYIVPGKHKANILDYVLTTGNIITQQFRFSNIGMKITLEKENLYSFNQAPANFCDTANRVFYFNYPLPRLINNKTSQVVSVIEDLVVFKPDNDPCNVVHLNYNFDGIDNNRPAVFPFVFSPGFQTLFLMGWTIDNFLIYYKIERLSIYEENKGEFVSKGCENLNFHLKPGYYWLGYNYEYTDYVHNSTAYSSKAFIFMAEPGDSIKIDQRNHLPDKSIVDFKVMHETNLNNIFFLPDGKHGWIVGDSKTILCTSDGGETWRYSQDGESYDGFSLNEKISYGRYKDILFIDSLNGWIASESGLLHTGDGGFKWVYKDVEPGASENLDKVRFFNKLFGFASQEDASLGNKLYCTTNGGESWKLLCKHNTYASFFCFSYNNIWKVGGSEISHSTDMGKTWTVSATIAERAEYLTYSLNPDGSLQGHHISTTRELNMVYFIDPLHGWLLKDGIQSTTDGGKTWEKQTINISPDMVYFINKDAGWAFTRNGFVCKTMDGGSNWSRPENKILMRGIRKVFFIDENKGWIVGEHGFIYGTSDGGQNWKVMNVLDLIK